MNYSIIKNEADFGSFIDWLPELMENEKFYLSLFARRKYSPAVKTDKANMKRFASDKKRLPEKVRQLECAQGSYTARGIAVPNDALALYICVNPRCTVKASFQTIIAHSIQNHSIQNHSIQNHSIQNHSIQNHSIQNHSIQNHSIQNHSIQNKHNNLNPHSEAITQLHKSPARKKYVVFDIDRKDDLAKTISTTRSIVGEPAAKFIETRGGVHVLIEIARVNSRQDNWYSALNRSIEPDQTGDLLIPVPGCCQGGFVPRFVF